MAEQLRTQISGKYSPDNAGGLFQFKRQLQQADIDVAFPVGDAIIEYEQEFAITVPQEAETPFHTTQVEFFRQIKENSVQTVYNMYNDNHGYMGESTTVETAYALTQDKPIVLLREPAFAPRAPLALRGLINDYRSQISIDPLDRMDQDDLAGYMQDLSRQQVSYGLTTDEKSTVMREALDLTRKYKQSWDVYVRGKNR